MRPAILALSLLAAPAAAQTMIDVETDRSVPEAVAALTDAVEGAGARVVATVDHQANAATVDAELRPLTKVIFGNPALGTPIMQADPRAGILLPQMVLVWEDADGQVRLSYLDPAEAMGGLDVPPELLEPVAGALRNLTAAAAG
ncbi:uncharacterized protein (DUF302 family) [Hasllibacter halocynthiae]|uniref:Uncharacterized protein (DUF302 family) n=1 Tax=Hasllibacter halocynthiae TaxID=595589 RepID=A0A2T0X7D0_9RHOB|nr:DUF302 domain-containing protein [Hasllibacter halocynthiae]PRY94805.1 uncharacterized protein (DUF302 family) [Hasllibacter halocynthiae]